MAYKPVAYRAIVGLFLANFAGPVSASASPLVKVRTVTLSYTDNKIQPATRIELRKGDTVRFVLRNKGKAVHEAIIGDAKTQRDHEKEMAAMGGHNMADESDRVTMKAGATKELTFKFDKSGSFELACHQPGHFAAGMRVKITVK